MPMPKSTILTATASMIRNNDWAFSQTSAPSAGFGALSETLKARINVNELPKSEATPVTGQVAGYTITHAGRHKTDGVLTIEIKEGADGLSSGYFESLKALNNPRNTSGQLTGVGVAESKKEGEYTVSLLGSDNKVVKKYTLKQAVVTDVSPSSLAPGEEAEFVSFTITIAYKDHTIRGASGQIIA